MYKYVIEGSKNISGTVQISGSKNASLPLLVASILTDEPITLHNVPDLVDVHVLINILEPLGKKVDFKNNTTVIISQNGKSDEAPYKLVKKMRGSIIVLGPLLAKENIAEFLIPEDARLDQDRLICILWEWKNSERRLIYLAAI